MPLPLAVGGACAGHGCDDCATCQQGRCCRRDDPDYRLPNVGDWDDPLFVDIGRLEEVGDTVTCHICGGSYVHLGTHAWKAHDVTAAEYRAYFGLGFQRALAGPDYRARMRERGLAQFAAGKGFDVERLREYGFKTGEQAAQAAARSNQRPEIRAFRREQGRQLAKIADGRGHRFGPGPRSDDLKRKLSEALTGKIKTPEHRQRIADAVRAAHARRKAGKE